MVVDESDRRLAVSVCVTEGEGGDPILHLVTVNIQIGLWLACQHEDTIS